METQSCLRCHRDLPLKSFRHRAVKGNLILGRTCSQCNSKKYRSRLRLEFLREFGGKCCCCGESHPQFITLEHIVGQDRKHKQSIQYQLMIAKRDGWDRTKYEALCYNCNCSKGKYGQCPHRTGVTAEQVYESLERDAKNLTTSGHRGFSKEERSKGLASRWAVEKSLKEIERVSNAVPEKLL